MISTEKFYLVWKENKKKFVKKIRAVVDSEFVKTCHEHVRRYVKLKFGVGSDEHPNRPKLEQGVYMHLPI